jgi:hypothetical protein
MTQLGLPLLAAAGIDVVHCGPSTQDDDGEEHYVLMRAFPSFEERERQERSFYSSEEWRLGPREQVLAAIETYHTVVLADADELIDAARHLASSELRHPARR